MIAGVPVWREETEGELHQPARPGLQGQGLLQRPAQLIHQDIEESGGTSNQ